MRAFFRMLAFVAACTVGLASDAYAACPSTPLANGTIADATKVMDWLDCKASLDNPSFNGSLVVSDSGQSQVHMIGNNGAQSQIRTEWEGTNSASRMMFYYTDVYNTLEEGFRLSGLGYVGIGNNNPQRKLDVGGIIRQAGCTTVGTLSVNSSGDIICTSDARLKNVLGSYSGGLDVIMQLTPQRFTYKVTPANPVEKFVHAGFIAQNVRTVIPEASAVQRDGYYSLDTTAILAASVNAIKELHKLADNQGKEIGQLRVELSDLRGHLIERKVVKR